MTATTPTPQSPQTESSLPIASFVMGITSLVGPGFLLGIPAIVTGAMALKRDTKNRGLSLAGLVTGIVSTILSFLFMVAMIFFIILGASMTAERDLFLEHQQQEDSLLENPQN